jgi:PmbA protein
MHESELLTRSRCREIFGEVQLAAQALGVRDVEVMLGATSSALTRFANNAIHQNVAEESRYLSIRPLIGQRTARATTNLFDHDSIRAAVEQAVALTHAQAPDPDLPALACPEPLPAFDRFSAATAASTPAERAQAVAEAVGIVRAAGQTAAGICSAGQCVEAILNSAGLDAYYCDTSAQFSITAMAADSSGWAKASAPDRNSLDPAALASSASRKAALSAAPRELSPGRYTVILEPAAVLDLVGQIFADFSATAMHDQRSFLTGRMGERLFGENITIYDDAAHPLQSGAPFDGEGVPRHRLTLVERGVPSQIAYSRASALREGVPATGHGFPLPNEYGEAPANVVMEGGDSSLEQLIASTERGILVTRVWYIREVDPFEKIMTGMTRDGTFLIENGRLAGGLRNFRFNQSVIELLSNVEAMTPAVHATGEETFDMVVPAMKAHGFRFSEVTRF